MTKADLAVAHILRSLQADGRKAYLLGQGTEAFRLLTEAHADATGQTPDAVAEAVWANCHPERVITETA